MSTRTLITTIAVVAALLAFPVVASARLGPTSVPSTVHAKAQPAVPTARTLEPAVTSDDGTGTSTVLRHRRPDASRRRSCGRRVAPRVRQRRNGPRGARLERRERLAICRLTRRYCARRWRSRRRRGIPDRAQRGPRCARGRAGAGARRRTRHGPDRRRGRHGQDAPRRGVLRAGVCSGGARPDRACVDLGESALPYAAVADALRGAPPEAFAELAPALSESSRRWFPKRRRDDEPRESTQGARSSAAVLRLIEALGRRRTGRAGPRGRPLGRSVDARPAAVPRAAACAQTAVLLVLTHRTDEVPRDHPVRELIADLQRAPRVRTLRAAATDPARDREPARSTVRRAGRGRARDAIHARSEGNPLFSEELLATGAGGRRGAREPA